MMLYWLILFNSIFNFTSACHSWDHPAFAEYRARTAGVKTQEGLPLPIPNITVNCQQLQYRPYEASELRALSTLAPFNNKSELTVEEGGRITCAFDSDKEYCSWHNANGGATKFWKGSLSPLFDVQRFDCTTQRAFKFDNNFLLVGGEQYFAPQTVAIETDIACQYEDATLKFDVWSNSEGPIMRLCIITNTRDLHCQEVLDEANPVVMKIPHSVQPFRLRLEVLNLNSEEMVIIDNLYYEGQICELVNDEIPSTTVTADPTPPRQSAARTSGTENTVSPLQEINNFLETPFGSSPTSTEKQDLELLNTAPPATGELTVCQALSCDFNSAHSCFYSMSGIGSTAPWIIANKLVGNRHTGIQRINLGDSSKVGFAYVGKDQESQLDELFVMESPKFAVDRNLFLVFDVYQRSVGPELKVCIDSFDYCPYTTPTVDPQQFWHSNQRIFLQPGVKKVYFIVSGVGPNLFIAIDSLRLQTVQGQLLCGEQL